MRMNFGSIELNLVDPSLRGLGVPKGFEKNHNFEREKNVMFIISFVFCEYSICDYVF